MKFRLTYAGILKSSGNKPKPKNKHALRLAFHNQLSVLWSSNPILREFSQLEFPNLERAINPDFVASIDEALAGEEPTKFSYSELLIAKHKNHDVNWHPLVTAENELITEVDILMLRPNDSKSIVQGGDIDGRVKTIFDALSIPVNGDVLSKFSKPPDVFYTLLSDDSLISKVSVDTDELLELDEARDPHFAHLIIEITTKRKNEPYIHI